MSKKAEMGDFAIFLLAVLATSFLVMLVYLLVPEAFNQPLYDTQYQIIGTDIICETEWDSRLDDCNDGNVYTNVPTVRVKVCIQNCVNKAFTIEEGEK